MKKYMFKSLKQELRVPLIIALVLEIIMLSLSFNTTPFPITPLFFVEFLSLVFIKELFSELFQAPKLNHYLTLNITRTQLLKLSYTLFLPFIPVLLLPSMVLLKSYTDLFLLNLFFLLSLIPALASTLSSTKLEIPTLIQFMVILLIKDPLFTLMTLNLLNLFFIFQNYHYYKKGNFR